MFHYEAVKSEKQISISFLLKMFASFCRTQKIALIVKNKNRQMFINNSKLHQCRFCRGGVPPILLHSNYQRWGPRGRPWPRGRPRGHILKSLALASKPQVLGLGLEASSPRKLPCPRPEDSTIFEPLKFRWKTPETSRKICEHLFCFPHLEHRPRQGEGGRLPP